MYSAVVEGKVLDFRYSKVAVGHYRFHIGDIYIGEVFRMGNMNWAATGLGIIDGNRSFPVEGFRSRYHASEYMLKVRGFWGND
jgi:hypothetical protein